MTITTKIIAAIVIGLLAWYGASTIVDAFNERAEYREKFNIATTEAETARKATAKAVGDAEAEKRLNDRLQIDLDTQNAKITKDLTDATRRLYDFRQGASPDVLRCLAMVVPDDYFVPASATGPNAGSPNGASDTAEGVPAARAGAGTPRRNRVQ